MYSRYSRTKFESVVHTVEEDRYLEGLNNLLLEIISRPVIIAPYFKRRMLTVE
jgi:hypothetical protein